MPEGFPALKRKCFAAQKSKGIAVREMEVICLEKYAQVIIDISRKGLDRPFSYRIPASLQDSVRAGSIVMVPFGAGNTLRKG